MQHCHQQEHSLGLAYVATPPVGAAATGEGIAAVCVLLATYNATSVPPSMPLQCPYSTPSIKQEFCDFLVEEGDRAQPAPSFLTVQNVATIANLPSNRVATVATALATGLATVVNYHSNRRFC